MFTRRLRSARRYTLLDDGPRFRVGSGTTGERLPGTMSAFRSTSLRGGRALARIRAEWPAGQRHSLPLGRIGERHSALRSSARVQTTLEAGAELDTRAPLIRKNAAGRSAARSRARYRAQPFLLQRELSLLAHAPIAAIARASVALQGSSSRVIHRSLAEFPCDATRVVTKGGIDYECFGNVLRYTATWLLVSWNISIRFLLIASE